MEEEHSRTYGRLLKDFFKNFCKDFTQARQVASYFTEPCGVCIYSGKHYKKQQFQHTAYIILSHKVKTSHSKRTA